MYISSSENSLKKMIYNLPSSQVWASQVFRASKWLRSSVHITQLSRCGCGLSAQPQIQTYQAPQEHLAPSTSTAASGLVNQCKSVQEEIIPTLAFLLLLLLSSCGLFSTSALIWTQTKPLHYQTLVSLSLAFRCHMKASWRLVQLHLIIMMTAEV